jgi:hypothetical protein
MPELKVTQQHLGHDAYLYIRQSTPRQVLENTESWGIEDNETPEQFADMAYGVKFKFSPAMAPGYCGDLYILSGDALGEPMTFIREDGNLVLVD